MELEPGPFWQREPMPLGPRVATPHLFEQLADLVVPTLRGVDPGLGRASDDVGRNVPTNIDARYAATAGVAEAAHAAQARVQDHTTAGVLGRAGDNADQWRTAVLRYLPQPDAPVEDEFFDPPPLPVEEPSERDFPGRLPPQP